MLQAFEKFYTYDEAQCRRRCEQYVAVLKVGVTGKGAVRLDFLRIPRLAAGPYD